MPVPKVSVLERVDCINKSLNLFFRYWLRYMCDVLSLLYLLHYHFVMDVILLVRIISI